MFHETGSHRQAIGLDLKLHFSWSDISPCHLALLSRVHASIRSLYAPASPSQGLSRFCSGIYIHRLKYTHVNMKDMKTREHASTNLWTETCWLSWKPSSRVGLRLWSVWKGVCPRILMPPGIGGMGRGVWSHWMQIQLSQLLGLGPGGVSRQIAFSIVTHCNAKS